MENKIKTKEIDIREKLTELFIINEEEAEAMIRDYGSNVIRIFLQKPYLLCHYKVKFDVVKKIISSKSNNKVESHMDVKIVAAAIIYASESHTRFGGHTFSYKCELLDGIKKIDKKIVEENIEKALEILIVDREIVRDRDSQGRECIYLSRLYNAEVSLANVIGCLAKMSKCSINEKDENEYDKVEEFLRSYNNSSFELNQNQIEAVRTALNNRVAVIYGKGGTGKTSVIKAITEGFKYISQVRDPKICLCSYTGKAVDVLSKKTGMQATTIHRLLGVGITRKDWGERNETEVLIIDECGLVGVELINLLIYSIKSSPNIRIVLVGDQFQIQSIEPGCVLKQLLKSRTIPMVELSEVVRQRNHRLIVDNADKILKGITTDGKKLGIWFKKDEFEFIEASSEGIKSEVINKIDMLLSAGTSIYDIQVISPYRKYTNGVDELNMEIARRFNSTPERQIYKFGILDSVIAIKNNFRTGVSNGQRGIIKRVETDMNKIELITVDFCGREVTFKNNGIQDIELFYVATIHKLQGSEMKTVIMIMDKKHERMINRELIYVGITRATEKIVIIGNKDTFNEGVKKVSQQRNSSLAERLIAINIAS